MFDVSAALNNSESILEIEIEHVAHIAAQITNVESETWVVAIDVVILVSSPQHVQTRLRDGRGRSTFRVIPMADGGDITCLMPLTCLIKTHSAPSFPSQTSTTSSR